MRAGERAGPRGGVKRRHVEVGLGIDVDAFGFVGGRLMMALDERGSEHQALDLLPYRAVEGRVAAHQVAAENQGKIGKEQLSKVHCLRIAATLG